MADKEKYFVISHRSLELLAEDLNSMTEDVEVIAYTQEFGVTKLLLIRKGK